jgi:hypothetical protein
MAGTSTGGARPDLGPRVDPTDLAVARFPAGTKLPGTPDGFAAVVVDEQETTVVCPADALSGVAGSEPALEVETGWRRITFPGPLPWELVGFLADVAGRLAAANVPFTSMSGFTTDHVLVRAAHCDLALAVLRGEPPPRQRPGTNP